MPHRADTKFVKRHGAKATDDWTRVLALATTCEAVTSLRAPRALSLDISKGLIGYERIYDMKSLLSAARRAGGERVLRDVGDKLACMHMAPPSHPLPSASRYGLASMERIDADLLVGALPLGLFHGDCWHGNLFVEPDGGIVILDPIPTEILFPAAPMVASGALDIATLHMSLFVCRPLAHYSFDVRREMQRPADALVDGYLSRTGAAHARPAVMRLSRLLAERWIAGLRLRLPWPIGPIKQRMALRTLKSEQLP